MPLCELCGISRKQQIMTGIAKRARLPIDIDDRNSSPKVLHKKVAGQSKHEVADKENAGTNAEQLI